MEYTIFLRCVSVQFPEWRPNNRLSQYKKKKERKEFARIQTAYSFPWHSQAGTWRFQLLHLVWLGWSDNWRETGRCLLNKSYTNNLENMLYLFSTQIPHSFQYPAQLQSDCQNSTFTRFQKIMRASKMFCTYINGWDSYSECIFLQARGSWFSTSTFPFSCVRPVLKFRTEILQPLDVVPHIWASVVWKGIQYNNNQVSGYWAMLWDYAQSINYHRFEIRLTQKLPVRRLYMSFVWIYTDKRQPQNDVSHSIHCRQHAHTAQPPMVCIVIFAYSDDVAISLTIWIGKVSCYHRFNYLLIIIDHGLHFEAASRVFALSILFFFSIFNVPFIRPQKFCIVFYRTHNFHRIFVLSRSYIYCRLL